MASHRVLIRVQRPDLGWWEPGEVMDYAGPPNWKFQPLASPDREKWEEEVAQPDRVEQENRRTNITGTFRDGEDVFPAGGAPRALPIELMEQAGQALPTGTLPSGWGQHSGGRR